MLSSVQASTWRLQVRADASAAVGTGHVMRMLALAQAARRTSGRPAVFFCEELPPALRARLEAEGCEVRMLPSVASPEGDARATLAELEAMGGEAVLVADGYRFGPGFQTALRAGGVRLMVMDDNGENGAYECDWILNQNIHATEAFYRRRPAGARVLLGPRFALLREEFLRAGPASREIPAQARRVLVTMGGADPGNMTGAILTGLAKLGPVDGELCVVLGGGNSRGEEIERAARVLPWATVRVARNVIDMAPVLAQADLAVTAGGSTCWEMCLLGLPMLVISIAENQRMLAQGLGAAGAACVAGYAGEFDPDGLGESVADLMADEARRRSLSSAARRLVDGRGCERVLSALRGEDVFLRPATMDDAERLWEWANDPAVRAVSFHPDPIPWKTHCAWLRRKLEDGRVLLLIAETDAGPAGMVRFEREEDGNAVVSVIVAASARGRGWGSKIIAAGTRRFADTSGCTLVRAYIKPGNRASVSVFERAGYGPAEDVRMAGAPALQRVWRRT